MNDQIKEMLSKQELFKSSQTSAGNQVKKPQLSKPMTIADFFAKKKVQQAIRDSEKSNKQGETIEPDKNEAKIKAFEVDDAKMKDESQS